MITIEISLVLIQLGVVLSQRRLVIVERRALVGVVKAEDELNSFQRGA